MFKQLVSSVVKTTITFLFQMLIHVHQVVKDQGGYVDVTTVAYGSKTRGEYFATMVFVKRLRSIQNALNRLNGNPLAMDRIAKIM